MFLDRIKTRWNWRQASLRFWRSRLLQINAILQSDAYVDRCRWNGETHHGLPRLEYKLPSYHSLCWDVSRSRRSVPWWLWAFRWWGSEGGNRQINRKEKSFTFGWLFTEKRMHQEYGMLDAKSSRCHYHIHGKKRYFRNSGMASIIVDYHKIKLKGFHVSPWKLSRSYLA